MMKHKYRIVLNHEIQQNCLTYKFGHTDDIKLYVGKQKAVIDYELSVKRTLEDFLTFSDSVFRDSFRKAHLVHALKYNYGLKVSRITFCIDDETFEITKGNDPIGHFPYMFSLIEGKQLSLTSKWNNLEQDVANGNKTVYEKDLRYAAIYSLLMSMSREYSIDVFSNLWTSMNALYKQIARDVIKYYSGIHNQPLSKRKKNRIDSDFSCINLLACFLEMDKVKLLSQKEREQKWKQYYSVEKILEKLTDKEINELYDMAKEELNGKMLPSKYQTLSEISAEFGAKTYTFLLLIYPYYLRCNYFHGDKPSLLITEYNSYEIGSLRLVNYFLSSFLVDNIPELFETGCWSGIVRKYGCEYLEYLING